MARIPNITTPSVKPGLPRKPPATSVTKGKENVIAESANQQAGVPYGAYHRPLKMVSGSERAGDFK